MPDELPGAGFDVRTRRPITPPTPVAPKSQKDILEGQRKRKLLRELTAHPGWAIFRAQAYSVVKPTIPLDVDSAVRFFSSAIARTTCDMIFNVVEGEAAQALSPEEMPVVDGARPSLFEGEAKLPIEAK
jgi:hypothetical protein